MDAYTHELSGKTISQFRLILCDDHGNVFTEGEHKNFSCVLKFETQDSSSENQITQRVLLQNQELGFKSRHMC